MQVLYSNEQTKSNQCVWLFPITRSGNFRNSQVIKIFALHSDESRPEQCDMAKATPLRRIHSQPLQLRFIPCSHKSRVHSARSGNDKFPIRILSSGDLDLLFVHFTLMAATNLGHRKSKIECIFIGFHVARPPHRLEWKIHYFSVFHRSKNVEANRKGAPSAFTIKLRIYSLPVHSHSNCSN